MSGTPLRLIVVLAALMAMPSMSVDMTLVAMTRMRPEFGVDAGVVQVSLSAYFVAFAVALVFYGPLSDRVGRRPALTIGLVLYGIGGLLCAIAPNIEALILGRMVQGAGACSGPMIARTVIRDLFRRDQGARVLSVVFGVFSVSPILSPIVAGHVVAEFGWRWVFVLLALAAVLVGLAVWVWLEETNRHRGGGVSTLARIVRDYPVLVRHRHFVGYGMTISLMMAATIAYSAGSSFVFVDVYGVAVDAFGYYYAATSAAFMAASFANAPLVTRFGVTRVLGWAVRLGALAGLAVGAVAVLNVGSAIGLAIPLALLLAAIGGILPNALAAALDPYPEKAGSASAMIYCAQMVFAASSGQLVNSLFDGSAVPMGLAIATLAMLGLGVYRWLVPAPTSNVGDDMDPDDVIRFWFDEAGPDKWFVKDPAFDETIRARFAHVHAAAAEGGLDHWLDAPESTVALVIVLDQFPRNMHRGSARAFASDAKAREVARSALERGHLARLTKRQTMFLLLPFEHSEDIEDQRLCLRLGIEADADPRWLDFARRHLEVIERFGRFPHRNAALGRVSSEAERAYLAQPNAGF